MTMRIIGGSFLIAIGGLLFVVAVILPSLSLGIDKMRNERRYRFTKKAIREWAFRTASLAVISGIFIAAGSYFLQ